MGVSLTKEKKPLEANKAFDDAEALDPKYVGLDRESRSTNHLAINSPQPQKVVREIDLGPRLQWIKLQPFASMHQKDFEEVLRVYSSALPLDAECSDAWKWCGRGSAFLEKNDPVSAIGDFGQAIRLAPDFAQAYCLRGRAYTMTGNYYRAISDTTNAIRLKPDCALAYFYRAAAYLMEKGLERAHADLDEAVKLDPELADQARDLYLEIYECEAREHSAARRWDKAIDCLEKSLQELKKAIPFDKNAVERLNSQLAKAHRERGSEHANRRKFEQAVSDLNMALDLDKDNAETYRICGLTCCRMAEDLLERKLFAEAQEQWKAAVKHLKWAIRLDPDLKRVLARPLEDAERGLAQRSRLPVTAQPAGI